MESTTEHSDAQLDVDFMSTVSICRERANQPRQRWSSSLAPRPLALAPHFVNNDYVTTEIIYSTAHVCHEVLAWPQATFVL